MLKPFLYLLQSGGAFCKIKMPRAAMFLFFLLQVCGQLQAKNYYFSASGDDAKNTGSSATSPWKSLEKLNSVMIGLQPGDSVLFRRGNVFHGELRITQSGTKKSVIYFGAYDRGEKPVFDGTAKVTGWKAVARNKWETTNAVALDNLTNLFINGVKQAHGRWPNANTANKGYIPIKWASGSTRLSSKSIPDASVWQGADLVSRTNRWVVDWSPILETSGDTITIRPANYTIEPNFGFFICNHPNTLDQQGEWCFNRLSRKIMLYFGKNPELLEVTIPVTENLVSVLGQKYITIENLVLKGSSGNSVQIDRSENITIRKTEIFQSGNSAVWAEKCKISLFEDNIVMNTNNNGVMFNECRSTVLRRNLIKNTGLSPAVSVHGSTSLIGLGIYGAKALMEYNRIDSTGYIGLRFDGDSMMVRHNVISNICLVKDDGGGIYTWNGNSPARVEQKIIGNIVYNSIGAACGTNDTLSFSAEGIYIDDGSVNVEVTGNTIYKCGNIGLFIHNSYNITARNNLVFDCNKAQLQMLSSGMPNSKIRGCIIKDNIFVSRTAGQRVTNWITDDPKDSIKTMGEIDSNYYCRPADPDMIIHCSFNPGEKWYSFDDWKQQFGYDQHTKQCPIRFGNKITSMGPPQKITYGVYHDGKDTWYDEQTTGKEALQKIKEDLMGNPDQPDKGMHLSLILSADINFDKLKQPKYLLSFDTKGKSAGDVIKANFKTPDNQIICSKEFKLENTFRTNELLYIPAYANKPHERVNFEFSNWKEPVWIKNITFRKVEVTLPNPDDHFLLVVNESGEPRVSPPLNGYVDVSGRACKGTIELPPYSSAIYFKK